MERINLNDILRFENLDEVKIRFNLQFRNNWNPIEDFKNGNIKTMLDGHYHNYKKKKEYKNKAKAQDRGKGDSRRKRSSHAGRATVAGRESRNKVPGRVRKLAWQGGKCNKGDWGKFANPGNASEWVIPQGARQVQPRM